MSRYIDADRLKEELRLLHESGAANVDNEVLYEIDDAPTADVAEVKRGRWLPVKGYEGILYRCSECEDKPYRHTTARTKYCPDCGAKMDEVEE